MKRILVAAVFAAAAPFASAQTDRPDKVLNIIDWNGHEVVSGELLVGFNKLTPAASQREIIEASGEELIWAISEDLSKVSVTGENTIDGLIEFFQQFDSVEYAEPNAIYYTNVVPNDSNWNNQWGPQYINAPAGWDVAKGSAGVAVAIIDTGIRSTHNDLDDKYTYGWDYYNNDSNPNDTNGHGTHCSGIAAAETNNNLGMAGIGWDTPIYNYRGGPGPSLDISSLTASLNDARNKGVHVTSNSWGGSGGWSSIQNACDSNFNAGMVNVAAAGNSGSTQQFYPAAYSSVLAVASNTQSGSRSGFSNYGSWVDVAAPGSGIYSTWNNSDNNYTNLDGTSMACPHVAGLAAVLYDMTDGNRNSTNRDIVWNTIRDTSSNVSWVDAGIIDMEAAVNDLDGGGGGGSPPGNCVDPVIYGQATPGTAGAPVPGFNSWPFLGNGNFELNVSNMPPAAQGTLFVGFGRASIPGPPFYLNVNLAGPPAAVIIPIQYDGSGQASLQVGIPNNPFINGLVFDAQWTAIDAGAQWGVAASEGMEAVVCDQNG